MKPRGLKLAAQLELALAALPIIPSPTLVFRPRPREGRTSPDDLMLATLRALGLRNIERCRLTRNRSVMVSWRNEHLRVHEGFVGAPAHVLEAIVGFVNGRGSRRREAQRVILAYPIERRAHAGPPVRREQTHPDDTLLVRRLEEAHARLNRRHFDGSLSEIEIRVSRRMRTRLGYFRPSSTAGELAEISIGRRHIRRHGWKVAFETLLHEMVHQWQHESGHALDHGPAFRRKAVEVGITPSATWRDEERRGTLRPVERFA